MISFGGNDKLVRQAVFEPTKPVKQHHCYSILGLLSSPLWQ